jgi:putative transposase
MKRLKMRGSAMKKKFKEEQIAFALKQAGYGTPVAEVIRKMGIAEQTDYRWKKKYGGSGMSELRRLKQLEEREPEAKADGSGAFRRKHRETLVIFGGPCGNRTRDQRIKSPLLYQLS